MSNGFEFSWLTFWLFFVVVTGIGIFLKIKFNIYDPPSKTTWSDFGDRY